MAQRAMQAVILKFLECLINTGNSTKDIELRLNEAMRALDRLKNILKSRQHSPKTKLRSYNVFNSIAQPVLFYLFYGSESWIIVKTYKNNALVTTMVVYGRYASNIHWPNYNYS